MMYGYINVIKNCFNSSSWVAMMYDSFKSPISACKFPYISPVSVDNLYEKMRIFSLVTISFISTKLGFQKHRYKENSMLIANGA